MSCKCLYVDTHITPSSAEEMESSGRAWCLHWAVLLRLHWTRRVHKYSTWPLCSLIGLADFLMIVSKDTSALFVFYLPCLPISLQSQTYVAKNFLQFSIMRLYLGSLASTRHLHPTSSLNLTKIFPPEYSPHLVTNTVLGLQRAGAKQREKSSCNSANSHRDHKLAAYDSNFQY